MQISRNVLVWFFIILFLALFFDFFASSGMDKGNSISFSTFLDSVKNKTVSEVVLQGNNVTGKLINGDKFNTYIPDFTNIVSILRDNGVVINAIPRSDNSLSFINILISWFPTILLLGVWIFFMRQMQSGSRGGALGFGRSKAKLLLENGNKITFADVAGIDEAKQELEEVVDFLDNPDKFRNLGGTIPKGILLVGPPGTGKTLLARAIAGEANVPFFFVSGSDFVEMFVGVGASRIRDLFEQGKKRAPCIVFIDEIDAVGRNRGANMMGNNDEREQTLNQLLVEMDGFTGNSGVILIAATNRPDVLDPALLRPGRFDRQVVIPNPDFIGREQILKIHTRNMPIAMDVDLKVLARGTPGFSGAELSNLANEAALLAAKRGHNAIKHKDLEEAKDKILMGAERRSLAMTDEDNKLTAYHEGGHALVTMYTDYDPIHKATIVPRGRALGLVQSLPKRDKHSVTYKYIKSFLAVAMAGRVAEELIFGKENVTSGASQDIVMATQRARSMVMEWGMSDLGPITYGDANRGEHAFYKSISEQTAREVDLEVKKIIAEAEVTARKILTEKREELDKIANALLKHETLTGDELKAVLEDNFDPDKNDTKKKVRKAREAK